MRRLLSIAFVLLLQTSSIALALPTGDPSDSSLEPGASRAGTFGGGAANPDAPSGDAGGAGLGDWASTEPYQQPFSRSAYGVETHPPLSEGGAPFWWYGHESAPSRAPTPQTVNVTSDTSIILFVENPGPPGPGAVQMPTDVDILLGAKPVALSNKTTVPFRAFNFSGKLFESTVGNRSLNASNDIDLGIPNQTVQVLYDGVPLALGEPVITGNSSSAIPAPFRFPNGTFRFTIPELPDYGCGPHLLTIAYDSSAPGNNGSFFGSSTKDFRVHQTCPTSLSLNVDLNPAVVNDTVTFIGTLVGPRAEAVPSRAIQVKMDGKLLGQTGPGVFVDDVIVDGTIFQEDFETNGTGWNLTGTGVGVWEVGRVTNPDGPIPVSGVQVAGTGLKTYYGKGVDTWLNSPTIDLTAPTQPFPQLRFYYWYNISHDDNFEVAFSIDGGLTFSNYTQISSSAAAGFVVSDPDAQGVAHWAQRGINITKFIGVAQLIIAFHFFSVDQTTVTSGSGGYFFRFAIPFETAAATHVITAEFAKGIPFDPTDGVTVVDKSTWDLSYQFSSSTEVIRLDVKRQTHFAYNFTEEQKTGYRTRSLTVGAKLLDNMGEAAVKDTFNPYDIIRVDIRWDYDFNDPFDTLKILAENFSDPNIEKTGDFKVNYIVDKDQPLGLHNVTYNFGGAKYYTPTTGVEVYRLMGHTYVIWPPDPLRQVFRFANATVNGSLRIIAAESRFNRQIGDAVDGELVKLTWDTIGIPEGQVGVLTDSQGGFAARKFVPFDDTLGRKPVVLTYDGSDIYVAVQAATNWSVVSPSTILFDNVTVYKGNVLWYNGSMLDDRGVGIGNQTLTFFFENETVAVQSTAPDGTFTVPFTVSTDMTVGLKEARIRFVGNPIYLANETVSYVPVKAHTQIVRTDHTQIVDRGKRLNVTGEMFEVYEGGIRGIPVAQEDIIIRIGDQRLTLQKSNTEGKFTFTSLVPADLPVGESTLFFEYIGTSYYDAAINNTLIVIRGQGIVKIDLVELRVNGHEFDTANQSVSQGQEVSGIWRVTDELGNPIQSGDFRAFFAYSAGALAEPIFISAGPLDDFGRYAFNVTWPINDFIVGNRTLIGQFNGSYCQTFISPRTLCVRGGTGNFTLNYTYIAPPEREPDYTLLIVVGAATAAILASAFYFFYYTAKRRQLQRMQRIIRRAADRLVAGNPYAQVIFDAYRALAGYLRTYGYLRKDSETFREFEVALRQALPIDAKAMDEFLSILEEARYSEHEIGEAQRDRAVAALGAVRGSIGALLESGGIPQAPGAVMAPPPPPPPA